MYNTVSALCAIDSLKMIGPLSVAYHHKKHSLPFLVGNFTDPYEVLNFPFLSFSFICCQYTVPGGGVLSSPGYSPRKSTEMSGFASKVRLQILHGLTRF